MPSKDLQCGYHHDDDADGTARQFSDGDDGDDSEDARCCHYDFLWFAGSSINPKTTTSNVA